MKQQPAIHRQWNRRKRGDSFDMVGRTDPSNSDNLNGDGGGRASACACVRDVFAIYDNNI